MKLEAVDKRNPVLIRVATVADVVYRQLRVIILILIINISCMVKLLTFNNFYPFTTCHYRYITMVGQRNMIFGSKIARRISILPHGVPKPDIH